VYAASYTGFMHPCRKDTLHVAEAELHGVTHAEIGAYLLGLWGLPYPIVEAVAHHHAPLRVVRQGFEVLDAVYVANCFAREPAPGHGEPVAGAGLDPAYLEAVGAHDRVAQWRAVASEVMAAPAARA
jgi:hypothetical protein